MNDKEFKQHLRDLAHGHHHPEEHDWGGGRPSPAKHARSGHAAPAKNAGRQTKRRSK